VLQQTRSHAERVSHRAIIGGMPWIRGALLKLGFHISQATVSRYMPRRGYPLTQTWRTFLRNQAFAIGTTGLGQQDGYQTRFLLSSGLDRASCRVRHQGAGWHPLQGYRAIAPIAAISLFLPY
jgi:hypothetical protein